MLAPLLFSLAPQCPPPSFFILELPLVILHAVLGTLCLNFARALFYSFFTLFDYLGMRRKHTMYHDWGSARWKSLRNTALREGSWLVVFVMKCSDSGHVIATNLLRELPTKKNHPVKIPSLSTTSLTTPNSASVRHWRLLTETVRHIIVSKCVVTTARMCDKCKRPHSPL